MKTRFIQAHDAVTRAGLGLAFLALVLMLCCYCLEVILRYFLATPTAWTADVVTYLLAIQFLLAVPWVTANQNHIMINLLVDKLSPVSKQYSFAGVSVMAAIVCAITALMACDLAITQYNRDAWTIATVPVPKCGLSLLIVYAFSSSAIYFLRQIICPPESELIDVND